jgi:hypothetical protein
MRECMDNRLGAVAALALLGLVQQLAGSYGSSLHGAGLVADVLRMLRFESSLGVRLAALQALAALAGTGSRAVNSAVACDALLPLAEWLAAAPSAAAAPDAAPAGGARRGGGGGGSSSSSGGAGLTAEQASTAALAAASTIDSLLESGVVDAQAVAALLSVEGRCDDTPGSPVSSASGSSRQPDTPPVAARRGGGGASSSGGGAGGGWVSVASPSPAGLLVAHCVACLPLAAAAAEAGGRDAVAAAEAAAAAAAPWAGAAVRVQMVAVQLLNSLITLHQVRGGGGAAVAGVAGRGWLQLLASLARLLPPLTPTSCQHFRSGTTPRRSCGATRITPPSPPAGVC